VFLDLKYHDIPNTVAEAVRAAAGIGADLVNVHAGGGPAMLAAAAAAGTASGILVVAVTVLTSIDAHELRATGIEATPAEQVVRLARLAQANGIPGVVCSALEIGALRQACGPEFILVVPGIRPTGSEKDDQKRVMTPRDAAAAGADYIVVGRPIRQAPDPQAAVRQILEDLKG
jgi:orotidine-5'-phosphate decarboxylase